MLPTVAILIPAQDAGTAGARIMADACSAAAPRQARCVAVASEPPQEPPLALVIVLWLDASHGSVTLHVRAAGSPSPRERKLEFAPADPDPERWRAVGFAIASLVVEQTSASPPEVAVSEPRPPRPPPPPPALPRRDTPPPPPLPPPPPAPRPILVGAHARLLSGVDSALLGGLDARVGIGLDGGVEVGVGGGLSLLGNGSRDQLRGSLLWLSSGVRSALWSHAPFRAMAHADLSAEQLLVEASRGGVAGALSRWQAVLGGGVDLELSVRDRFAVDLGAEIGLRSGTTTIVISRTETYHLRPLRPGLGLGFIGRF